MRLSTAVVLGAGLVGTFSARALSAAGVDVVTADLAPCRSYFARFGPRPTAPMLQVDIRDSAAVRRLLGDVEAEVVVVCAGMTAGASARDPAQAWSVHVDGTRSVAQAATDADARRLVFLSSAAVYGRPGLRPVHESDPAGPLTTYGRTKAEGERTLLPYEALDVVVLRAPGVYGPVRPGAGSRSAQLIQNLLLQAVNGRPVALQVEPDWADEYLYVKDLARAIVLAARSPDVRGRVVWNVGTGSRTTAGGLCEALRQVVPQSLVTWEPTEPSGGTAGPSLDSSRIRQDLGYEPRFDLVCGLHDHRIELAA